MVKITPTVTACKLTVRLRAVGAGTEATVTYTPTSLGPEGDDFVASFPQEHYQQFMRDWETRLNHYLVHGTVLRAQGGHRWPSG